MAIRTLNISYAFQHWLCDSRWASGYRKDAVWCAGLGDDGIATNILDWVRTQHTQLSRLGGVWNYWSSVKCEVPHGRMSTLVLLLHSHVCSPGSTWTAAGLAFGAPSMGGEHWIRSLHSSTHPLYEQCRNPSSFVERLPWVLFGNAARSHWLGGPGSQSVSQCSAVSQPWLVYFLLPIPFPLPRCWYRLGLAAALVGFRLALLRLLMLFCSSAPALLPSFLF